MLEAAALLERGSADGAPGREHRGRGAPEEGANNGFFDEIFKRFKEGWNLVKGGIRLQIQIVRLGAIIMLGAIIIVI